MTKKMEFIDAQQMNETYPDTFEVPDYDELNKVGPGSFVKVSAGQERFWVKVTGRKNDIITGYVDNDLLMTDSHGYKLGDEVELEPRHIYQVIL